MFQFIGKVILVSALVFLAFSLFDHSDTINKFNSNLPGVLKQIPSIPSTLIKTVTENVLYVRYAVVGLLGLSALLILTTSRFLIFLVLVGTNISDT